jgi:hypothetical protein
MPFLLLCKETNTGPAVFISLGDILDAIKISREILAFLFFGF